MTAGAPGARAAASTPKTFLDSAVMKLIWRRGSFVSLLAIRRRTCPSSGAPLSSLGKETSKRWPESLAVAACERIAESRRIVHGRILLGIGVLGRRQTLAASAARGQGSRMGKRLLLRSNFTFQLRARSFAPPERRLRSG